MHEMAITQSVVDAVCEHAAGRRVHSVRLEVGALCAVVPDAMQFCFELATEGTVADGARCFLATQQQFHGQTDNIAHSDAAKKPVQTSSTSVSGQHPDA